MTQANIVPTSREPLSHESQFIPLTEALGRFQIRNQHHTYATFAGALKTGIHVMGGPGTGKSRLVGREIAWLAVLFQLPLLIIDGVGGCIDNFLHTLSRLPFAWRRPLARHIRYIDVGATDSLVPTQLYYRLSPQDTLFAIANRLPSIIERMDEDLKSAPILGLNSLKECAVNAGMIAAALNRQLDFVVDLVRNPRLYKEDLRQAGAMHPELQTAVAYFRDLMDDGKQSLREKRTGSFLSKLLPFTADRLNLARYAASRPGIDWEEVERKRLMVLIDLRHVQDPDQQQFAYLWYFKQFTDYITYRGMKGRENEFLLVLDEISKMLRFRTREGKSLLEDDINDLLTVIGRNYGVNVVIAHQNLMQVNEGVQNALMQMGTQCIGRLPNPKDAQIVAEQLLTYDPYLIKKLEPIWMNVSTGLRGMSAPTIVDYRTVEFTLDEQIRILVDRLKNLDRFQFLLQRAQGEGRNAATTRLLPLDTLDPGQYPQEEEIARIRALFRQRCGVPVEEVLQELEQRKPPAHEPPPKNPAPMKRKKDEGKAVPRHGKIGELTVHDDTNRSLRGEKAPAPPPARADEDDPWR